MSTSRIIISLLFFSLSVAMWAQTDTSREIAEIEKNYKLHFTPEVVDIMQKSSIHYEIKKVQEGEKPYSDFSFSGIQPQIPNPYARLKTDGSQLPFFIDEPQGELKRLFDEGRRFLDDKKPAIARWFFEKATSLNPNSFKAWSYLAQTYLAEDKFIQAIGYFKKAISLNEIAHEEYLLLGICYFGAGDYFNALDALTDAYMYDKIDPLLLTMLDEALSMNGLKIREQRLSFPFFIEAVNERECIINIIGANGENWFPIASLVAVWQMEPEFKKIDKIYSAAKMFNTLKIKECLLVQMAFFEDRVLGDKKLNELESYLYNTIKAGYMQQILAWEIAASTVPSIIFLLSRDERMKLKNYIRNFVYIKN